jgi:hypothetical protein
MTFRRVFRSLKELQIDNLYVSLAVIQEYKRNRISHYILKYVRIDDRLEVRLKNILKEKINQSNSIEEYEFDCPEPEEDQVRIIESNSTDFQKINEILVDLNPEEDVIIDVDDLVKAKSYIIILRSKSGIELIGFKKIPENWKMKKQKGFIPLLYSDNMFVDLEVENVFSISSTLDFISFQNYLFILSKKAFESGLNFREGMISKAESFYEEVQEMALFDNLEILTTKVGNNLRYLKKIATIKNLGHYKDSQYLSKLKEVNDTKNWGIDFQNGQINITPESLEDILIVLQNKRLHSEITEEDFDVESVKPLSVYQSNEAL